MNAACNEQQTTIAHAHDMHIVYGQWYTVDFFPSFSV